MNMIRMVDKTRALSNNKICCVSLGRRSIFITRNELVFATFTVLRTTLYSLRAITPSPAPSTTHFLALWQLFPCKPSGQTSPHLSSEQIHIIFLSRYSGNFLGLRTIALMRYSQLPFWLYALSAQKQEKQTIAELTFLQSFSLFCFRLYSQNYRFALDFAQHFRFQMLATKYSAFNCSQEMWVMIIDAGQEEHRAKGCRIGRVRDIRHNINT